MSSLTFNTTYDKWPIALLVYKKDDSAVISISIDEDELEVSDGDDDVIIAYQGKSLREIATAINSVVRKVFAKTCIDIGSESIISGSLITPNEPNLRITNSPYTIFYKGVISRPEETSIIQLKPPRAKSGLEPWYARISKGKFGIRFNDTSLYNYPGISPDTVYIFGVPEFKNQEWSLNYGAPYKDVAGEKPYSIEYSSYIKGSILSVSKTPIYYRNKNISISINGANQSSSIIKFVDENNGLIYLNQKLNPNSDIRVDYSFKETDYEYDAIDLNASTNHNPLLVDTYVAFYLKPIKADGSIISGGKGVFHEVYNTRSQAKTKLALPIKGVQTSSYPLYEPVIYLGSMTVRQSSTYKDFEVIDTRTRGGGIKEDLVEQVRSRWREAEFFFDIADFNGIDIPGNAGVIIEAKKDLQDKFERDELKERASKSVAVGIVPLINFKEKEPVEELILKNDNIHIEFVKNEKLISLYKLKNLNDLSETIFDFAQIAQVVLESIDTPLRVGSEFIFSPTYQMLGRANKFNGNDFSNLEITKTQSEIKFKWEGLKTYDKFYPSVYLEVKAELKNDHIDLSYSHNFGLDKYIFRGVEFPITRKSSDGADFLVLGLYGGVAVGNPATSLNSVGVSEFYQYLPGFLLPLVGDWDSATKSFALFFPKDKNNRLKITRAYKNGDGTYTKSYGNTISESERAKEYELPYTYELRQYSGDWYDAAQFYGSWSLSNLDKVPKIWDTTSPNYEKNPNAINLRAQVSPGAQTGQYLVDTGNRIYTGYPDFNIFKDRLSGALDFLGLKDKDTFSILYRWHTNEFDNLWPEWSVLSGVLSYKTGIESITSGKHIVCPYINTFFETGTATAIENNFSDYYPLDYDGNVLVNSAGSRILPSATVLTPGLPEADQIVSDSFIDLFKTANAFSGVYVDFYAGITAREMYDSNVSEYNSDTEFFSQQWVNRFRNIRNDFKSEATGLLTISESIDERFIGVSDILGWTISNFGFGLIDNYAQQYSSVAIPLWPSIYGGYCLTTPVGGAGFVATDNPGADIDYANISQLLRNVHYGIVPNIIGYVNNSGTNTGNIFGITGSDTGAQVMLKNLVSKHDLIAPVAYYGRRLKPYDVIDETIAIYSTGWSPTYGNVGISIWEKAQSGNTSILVSNINKTLTRTGTYTLSSSVYGLSKYSGLYEITTGGASYITPVTGDFTYSFVCDPLNFRIYEFR